MLRNHVLFPFALLLLGNSMAYATNGDTMLAVGSQNTALGGSGVANFVGAESSFANPALLGKAKGRELTAGSVLFKPSVTNTGFTGNTPVTSSANTNYIPDVSYSDRASDSLTYGVALAGIAGMGVNYSDASASYVKARTTLSILKVIPTIAYNQKEFGIGISPVFQYGSLAISYATQNGAHNPNHDADSHSNFGYNVGGYYNINPALTVAAAYNSSIEMTYGHQLSSAGTGFMQSFSDTLTQPAELKAGFAYTISSNYTVTADYRSIEWASAKGYKEFGWENQTVLAFGGKYATDGYWLGVGYNKSDNPIGVFANGLPNLATNGANGQNGIGNLFNNLMFPAVVKSAFTFGGGYTLTKDLAIEASAMIAPKVTTRVDISDATNTPSNPPNPAGSLYNTTTHSQQSYSVSLRYKLK
jgi:long-chain fatty acid transport protein